MIHLLICMFILAVIAFVVFIYNNAHWTDFGSTQKDDHDISNLLPSDTSTGWSEMKCCSHCHSEISHKEWMTSVCLSCGNKMRGYYSAVRSIVRGGKWVKNHMDYNDKHLLQLPSGKWVFVHKYDAEMENNGEMK